MVDGIDNPLGTENRFRPKNFGKTIADSVTMYLDNNKTAFHGWEDLTVTKSLDNLSNAFSFTVPQKFQQTDTEFKLAPGVRVNIFVNKERVLTGRIDRTSISISAANKSVTFSGRSLNSDLVDCTVEGAKEYKNIPLENLARQLVQPFGLKVFLSVTPATVPKVAIKPGDTVFEVLDKYARLQGFFGFLLEPVI